MPPDTIAYPWQDNKRLLWPLGLLVPTMPFSTGLVVALTGNVNFWWLAPAVMFLLIPLLDWIVGDDRNNPPESVVADLEQDSYYRYVVYAYVPLQYAGTLFCAAVLAGGRLSFLECIPVLIIMADINGIAINTAHELGHKHKAFERWLAKLTLAPVAYGHFFVEHNLGHHRRVATPEDPASARMGESFWRFLPRTMWGSLKSAIAIERRRLKRRGLPFWHWQNEILQAWSMTIVLYAAIVMWLGWAILPLLFLQAFLGASLLEVVNYVEHYGLLRQRRADGSYERCQPTHSWNSDHIVTNLLLYQLQRHSDHHASPRRAYQALRHFDDSPQLPSGYASMMVLAYIPSLWFRIMDPKVAAHYGGDLSRANLLPEKADALKARYNNPALA